MKRVVEFGRFLIISYEFIVLLLGICAQSLFSIQIQALISNTRLQDEQLKFMAVIPASLCVWSFISGRKLLFPEKDKSSILQGWPDYWRLKSGFHAALTWNVVFFAISVFAWSSEWKTPSATSWIWLAISLLGAGVCCLSIYNVQNHLEEQISQCKENR
jgi:hypothetical protein